MLDSIDKKLINLLQNDSKQTTKQLSLQLNLSVTAIYERIRKLENQNVIEKYVAIINKNKIEKSFLVFCHIKLVQHSREYVTTFEREILKLTEVSECFHVSGDYDYILKIYVKNMDEYRNFMVTKLTAIKYIGSTHSIFTIEQVKNTTVINL
ncbi:AsnC family transcriptional regulator [Polaribacter vadi]|jgi:Lrp/AsnC family leucine-responsive transcriptional regulator|uniref:AsnC family transcriptional regulator n=1 Tax=Polaribacter vadi TaxID=1774273 RepID=A0A1B8TR68_9FLAO|nr:Lrp/AsnC family transcriptional regulator [Polaribacter vadi]AOW18540.1 AsnC family transcriptional regulator [Polaribacter vadi]OBY62099.1 AsnC family transcriptional regulator [Polaribacter vadi]|tara:strand:- start:8711 stop:9166 length:456 start_codon:yes stop_codon:yes gene_type:complete